jgi:hypothetical protein
MICGARAHEADAAECPSTDLGLEPGAADTVVFAYETRGYGQVVFVPDTVVKSFTVWRPARPDTDALPRQVIVTGVDASGTPDVLRVLLHGPIVVGLPSDGVHPVEYRFVFDPPLVLPEAGRYFFDVVIADCFGGEAFLAGRANPYQDGQAWFTFGNRYACGYPTYPWDYGANIDLMFRVELCRSVTGIRRATWGHIKGIYR